MIDYKLTKEVRGYTTAPDQNNTDPRYLVNGSQNVLIDRQLKVSSRNGYTRLGVANDALTPIRSSATWNSSTGLELAMRMYDDELEVYLETVDTIAINAWTRVVASLSTSEIIRYAVWWDTTENIDLLLFIQGNANVYEWGGGVAVVDSITGTTITKKGTTTFAQNRFYTARNMVVTCVRTGTDYTYTGGAGTTTLTGIADTTGLIAGDILVQKIVTQSNKPAASHTNDTIAVFENQLIIGSFDDSEVFISQNDSYTDFTYSAPRIAGEGALLTLDGPSGGFGVLSDSIVAFAGRNSVFKAVYQEIAVGTTLTENLSVKRLETGVDQGCQSPDSIVSAGGLLIYLSYEPSLRSLEPADIETKALPKTLSNPIKPDFDAETWTNAQALWYKNALYLTAPSSSKLYILEYIEDADGNLRRFWQPPQLLPVRSLSIIGDALHGHSNAVAETYKLFDGLSDTNSSDEKLPINAIAAFAYNDYGKRGVLKNFDEYAIEGYISPSTTDLLLTLKYDYSGATQILECTIDGTDEDIIEDITTDISLGQQPLGRQPLGGAMDGAEETRKFYQICEIAKESFNRIQVIFSTNEVDRAWAIISHGCNATLSNQRYITNKK